MNKEDKIKEYLNKPLEVGQSIWYKRINSRDKEVRDLTTITRIEDYIVYFNDEYGTEKSRPIEEIEIDTRHIGANPFKPALNHTSYQIDIAQLFSRCGWDRGKMDSRMERYFGVDIPEVCLNPTVIDENGNEVEYQRDLVWTLEQKQLLIESIYNNVEIGKFVLRFRPFDWVQKRIKSNNLKHTAFKDLVDGKQRFTTLLEFVQNKFKDMNGNYYSELSHNAQREFFSYRHLTYVELGEKSTDADALNIFLSINHTGVPMSKEHIEFVKSINL